MSSPKNFNEMTREQKDELSRQQMEKMFKMNELLRRRHAEVERDKRSAEENNSSITNAVRGRRVSSPVPAVGPSEATNQSVARNPFDGRGQQEDVEQPAVIYPREWDRHKTSDSAWEPPEIWNPRFNRNNKTYPDKKYNKSRDFTDRQGSYQREDRRYRNTSFQSADTWSKFRKETDDPQRNVADNTSIFHRNREDQNNMRGKGRGRGRGSGVKPKSPFGEKNNSEGRTQTLTFKDISMISPPHEHDMRRSPSPPSRDEPNWSSSSSSDHGEKNSAKDSFKKKAMSSESKWIENQPSNKTFKSGEKFSSYVSSSRFKGNSRLSSNYSRSNRERQTQHDDSYINRPSAPLTQANVRQHESDSQFYGPSKGVLTRLKVTASHDKRVVQYRNDESGPQNLNMYKPVGFKSFHERTKQPIHTDLPPSDIWGETDDSKPFKDTGASNTGVWSDVEETEDIGGKWGDLDTSVQKPVKTSAFKPSTAVTSAPQRFQRRTMQPTQTSRFSDTWKDSSLTNRKYTVNKAAAFKSSTVVSSTQRSKGEKSVQRNSQSSDGWPDVDDTKQKKTATCQSSNNWSDGWPNLDNTKQKKNVARQSSGTWSDAEETTDDHTQKSDVNQSQNVREGTTVINTESSDGWPDLHTEQLKTGANLSSSGWSDTEDISKDVAMKKKYDTTEKANINKTSGFKSSAIICKDSANSSGWSNVDPAYEDIAKKLDTLSILDSATHEEATDKTLKTSATHTTQSIQDDVQSSDGWPDLKDCKETKDAISSSGWSDVENSPKNFRGKGDAWPDLKECKQTKDAVGSSGWSDVENSPKNLRGKGDAWPDLESNPQNFKGKVDTHSDVNTTAQVSNIDKMDAFTSSNTVSHATQSIQDNVQSSEGWPDLKDSNETKNAAISCGWLDSPQKVKEEIEIADAGKTKSFVSSDTDTYATQSIQEHVKSSDVRSDFGEPPLREKGNILSSDINAVKSSDAICMSADSNQSKSSVDVCESDFARARDASLCEVMEQSSISPTEKEQTTPVVVQKESVVSGMEIAHEDAKPLLIQPNESQIENTVTVDLSDKCDDDESWETLTEDSV